MKKTFLEGKIVAHQHHLSKLIVKLIIYLFLKVMENQPFLFVYAKEIIMSLVLVKGQLA
jgi:hypothetical protein